MIDLNVNNAAVNRGGVPENVAAPKEEASVGPQVMLPPILRGTSLVVGEKHIDINALVERLKVTTRHQKEEQQQSLMASAIAAVVGQIAASDAEQAKLLDDFGKMTDKYHSLTEEAALLAAECYANDPAVVSLEIKVKELEESVARMRKSPEEQKSEIEKKEKELEQAQKDLDQARLAALEKNQDYQAVSKEIADLGKDIVEVRNKLDDQSIFLLSQALRDIFFDPSQNKGDEEARAKRLKAADSLQFFAALLGGENMQELIDEGKAPYNYI